MGKNKAQYSPKIYIDSFYSKTFLASYFSFKNNNVVHY